jgi:hypothetical protein
VSTALTFFHASKLAVISCNRATAWLPCLLL